MSSKKFPQQRARKNARDWPLRYRPLGWPLFRVAEKSCCGGGWCTVMPVTVPLASRRKSTPNPAASSRMRYRRPPSWPKMA